MNLQSVKNLPILTESVTIDITPLSLYGHTDDLAKITANIKLVNPMSEDTRFILPVCDSVKAAKVYLPTGETISQDFEPTAEDDIAQIPNIIQQSISNYLTDPSMENMNESVRLMSLYSEYKQATQIITIPAGQQYITFSYSKYIPKNADNTFSLKTIVPLSDFTLNNIPGSKANIIILMPFEMATDTSKVIEAKWISPNGQPQDLNKTIVDGRIALSQYWQYDPQVSITYRY